MKACRNTAAASVNIASCSSLSQDEIESQIRYLEEENEAAAAELKQLVAAVRSVREALRTAYREAATDGTRITID